MVGQLSSQHSAVRCCVVSCWQGRAGAVWAVVLLGGAAGLEREGGRPRLAVGVCGLSTLELEEAALWSFDRGERRRGEESVVAVKDSVRQTFLECVLRYTTLHYMCYTSTIPSDCCCGDDDVFHSFSSVHTLCVNDSV